ncbi:collagen [Mactra antiquata]
MEIQFFLLVFVCTTKLTTGLTCYNCGMDTFVSSNNTQCQEKSVCADGEKCMLRTLSSSVDGHTEYAMQCASVKECDGNPEIVGKRGIKTRNIRYECCSTDLCNMPSPTSVNNQTCSRDIQIMLEDSLNITRVDYHDLVMFVKSMVSQLGIGPQANQVGLSTFDSNIDHKWDLDRHVTQANLQAALDKLTFNHHTRNNADIHRVVDFLVDSALRHINGDRKLVPDTVVIFIDQMALVRLRDAIVNEKHLLDNVSRDVILVVVGPNSDPTTITQLYNLASSSGHVLHASGYSTLMSIQTQLLNLLCQ